MATRDRRLPQKAHSPLVAKPLAAMCTFFYSKSRTSPVATGLWDQFQQHSLGNVVCPFQIYGNPIACLIHNLSGIGQNVFAGASATYFTQHTKPLKPNRRKIKQSTKRLHGAFAKFEQEAGQSETQHRLIRKRLRCFSLQKYKDVLITALHVMRQEMYFCSTRRPILISTLS